MRTPTWWRRAVPGLLAGFLILYLFDAITTGSRGAWLSVAVVALALAVVLYRRRRGTGR